MLSFEFRAVDGDRPESRSKSRVSTEVASHLLHAKLQVDSVEISVLQALTSEKSSNNQAGPREIQDSVGSRFLSCLASRQN